MLLDHHLSKQRPKGHADSSIYACFVHQTKDSQTLEENVKEAAAEKLFSATPAFIWHLTQEVGEKKMFSVTYDSSPHFISLSPFNFCSFRVWDSGQIKKCVSVCVCQAPSAGVWMIWSLLLILESTGKQSWMEHTFPIEGIKTKHTTEQDNWEEISFLLGESVLSFYFCYYSLFFPFFSLNSHPVNRHTLSFTLLVRIVRWNIRRIPWWTWNKFLKPFTTDFFSQVLQDPQPIMDLFPVQWHSLGVTCVCLRCTCALMHACKEVPDILWKCSLTVAKALSHLSRGISCASVRVYVCVLLHGWSAKWSWKGALFILRTLIFKRLLIMLQKTKTSGLFFAN